MIFKMMLATFTSSALVVVAVSTAEAAVATTSPTANNKVCKGVNGSIEICEYIDRLSALKHQISDFMSYISNGNCAVACHILCCSFVYDLAL